MHGIEPETRSPNTEKDRLGRQTPGEDPMDKLIAELREQFKLGLTSRAAQKKTARRKRKIVTFVVVLAGAIFAIVLFGMRTHLHH